MLVLRSALIGFGSGTLGSYLVISLVADPSPGNKAVTAFGVALLLVGIFWPKRRRRPHG